MRGAWATLKARESSLGDRVTAAKVLLFLTFEDPSSRSVLLCCWMYARRR